MELARAVASLQAFTGRDLTATLASIERSLQGATLETSLELLTGHGASNDAFAAAGVIKRIAGQINVVVHALGILLCLPKILEPGEVVEYVSLGAGNTGRAFDLETSSRVAEFKFIRWQGGAEAIRQNTLFKDFYLLAEHDSSKRKFLYVLGTEYPLKFLASRRSIASVLSHNVVLSQSFAAMYPDCTTVRDYYLPRQNLVTVQDVSPWLAELLNDLDDA